METYEADEVAVAGFRIALAVGEQEEMLSVYVEPVFRKRLPASAMGICLEIYFLCSRLLPGERKEHDGEIPAGFRYRLRFSNCIYASDGFHRCKTTSDRLERKGHTKSYFRQIEPCNTRRKISGVGLVFCKK